MSYLDETEPRREHEGEKLAFYRPPLGEILRHLEWGWVIVGLFGSLCLVMILAGLALGRYFIELTIFGGQLLLVLLATPLLFWESVRNRMVRSRRDPFCIHCGWTLSGLPEEGRCPECGQPYRFAIVEMFRRDPQWVIAYWRFAGRPPTTELFDSRHPKPKARCS